MTYRKSDGPFGMLPKKTAMDLEWAGGLHTGVPQREIDSRSHRAPEPDFPASQPVAAEPRDSQDRRPLGARYCLASNLPLRLLGEAHEQI